MNKTLKTQTQTAWQPKTTLKQVKPLTKKQDSFVKQLVTNPKQSAVKAVLNSDYGKPGKELNYNTAHAIASENLQKPAILAELAKHSVTAEIALLEVLNKSKEMMNSEGSRAVDWAVNTRQTADSILDRNHGKATQRVESQSTAVEIHIDLTGTVNRGEEQT